MPEPNLESLLGDRVARDQAAWYRILCDKNPRKRCQEYLVTPDSELLRYHDKTKKEQLRDELKKLKETLVEELRQQVQRVESPAAVGGPVVVEWAYTLGALLAPDLKMAQIRRLLGAILRIETEVRKEGPERFPRDEAEYLRVYLAYAAGRKEEARPLLNVLEPLVQKVREGKEGWEDFQRLARFVRAVVAYHKFFGGGE